MENLQTNEVRNLNITIEDIIEHTASTEEDIKTRELDGFAMNHPFYETHKRGSNWFAKLTGKNAANMDREFLKMRNDVADLSELQTGDVFEIGSNYVTSTGRTKYRLRAYYFIISINEDEMVYQRFDTAAEALRQQRNILKALN